jgi:hypothetical protein
VLVSICAFLNTSGGGYLFFNCKETEFGFIPEGKEISLKEQESLKSSF